MPYIAKTPKPPYYAVVFTSINADVDHTEHTAMYSKLPRAMKDTSALNPPEMRMDPESR
jgi:hypothetical protein